MGYRVGNSDSTSLLSAFAPPERAKKKSKEKRPLQAARFLSLLYPKTDPHSAVQDPSLVHEEHQTLLAYLQDRLCSTGDILKNTRTLETIAAYKQAVKEFVQYAIKHNYTTESKSSIRIDRGTGMPDTVIFTKIKVIDQKLASFVRELMSHQVDQLTVLQKTEEIYGMLVDLLI